MSRAAPLRRLLDSEKAARAAEMLRDGDTYEEIAKVTGYKHRSGVFRLLERHREALVGPLLEELRASQTARCLRGQDVALKLMADPKEDADVRLRAAATVARMADTIARISGVVKAPPPIVQVNVSPTASYDLSRLSIDDVRALAEIRRKMATPPELIEAKGHDVTEPTEPTEPTQPEPKDEPNGTDYADDHDET